MGYESQLYDEAVYVDITKALFTHLTNHTVHNNDSGEAISLRCNGLTIRTISKDKALYQFVFSHNDANYPTPYTLTWHAFKMPRVLTKLLTRQPGNMWAPDQRCT